MVPTPARTSTLAMTVPSDPQPGDDGGRLQNFFGLFTDEGEAGPGGCSVRAHDFVVALKVVGTLINPQYVD